MRVGRHIIDFYFLWRCWRNPFILLERVILRAGGYTRS